MHHWKPVEAKNNPAKDTRQPPNAGWTQSSPITGPNEQASTSSNSRQFREFRSPNDPPAWPGNENQHRTVAYQSSSDEEDEMLVITKYPVQARPPLASIQADKDGWYNWDVPPSLVQRTNPKEQPSTLSPNSELVINSQTSTCSIPTQYVSPAPADFAANPEAVDISFLEDFDKSLVEEDNNLNTNSTSPREQIVSCESPPSSRVSLPNNESPIISRIQSAAYQANSEREVSERSDTHFSYVQCMNDLELEVSTRNELEEPAPDTGGHGLLIQNVPVNTGTNNGSRVVDRFASHSRKALVAESDEDEEQSPATARVLSPDSTLEDDETHGINDSKVDRTVPPVPAIEHSREQSQRLRLYSTLYADFARDPWKWHERRDVIREMFPSLQSGDAESSELPKYGEHNVEHQWELEDKYRDPRERNRHYTIDLDNSSSRGSFEMLPVSQVADMTNPTAQGSVVSKRLVPLEGQQYCQKCRRHFHNTWRMQKHLADSRIHPYYCQVCTVDYSSFRELYMHYAEQSKCRPPELEFGPAKPFLQILAEYQITGRREAARKKSAADAKEALALTEDQNEASGEPGIRRAPSRVSNRASEAPACPICMVPLMKAKEVLVTACGHVYCSSCILHYFSKERPNCPKCRTPVSKATLVPLELH